MRTLRYRDTCEILVSEGLVAVADIESARTQCEETGEGIIETLLRESSLSESDLARCLCAQHQLPMIPISRYQIAGDLLLSLDPVFSWEHGTLPLSRIGSTVLVAVPDIPPPDAIAILRDQLEAEPFLTISSFDELQLEISRRYEFTEERKIEIDREVRTKRRGGKPPERISAPTGLSSTSSLLEALDDSWEDIFEEAEKNVRDGSA
ncbi:MAG: hypothetical protein VYD70_06575 [Planctomycetota bacterium]|nr:hypothetical protein [Planctomycetota bacterium]